MTNRKAFRILKDACEIYADAVDGEEGIRKAKLRLFRAAYAFAYNLNGYDIQWKDVENIIT